MEVCPRRGIGTNGFDLRSDARAGLFGGLYGDCAGIGINYSTSNAVIRGEYVFRSRPTESISSQSPTRHLVPPTRPQSALPVWEWAKIQKVLRGGEMSDANERWQIETVHEISRCSISLLLKVPISAEHEPAMERIMESLHDLLEECSGVKQ